MLFNRGFIYFFVLSHIFGWITATVQTIWIVHELEETIKTELRKNRTRVKTEYRNK